jgi:transposase
MDDVNFPGWRSEKSIQVVEGNGRTRVLVKGKPYMSWHSGDEGCVRLAIAQLYECGLGTEEDLAEAFGRHVNSVQKYLKDFADEGIRGLMSERRGPKGRWKLTPELRGKILLIVLREGISKLEAIQQRLLEAWHEAVSVPSIQHVLEENGLGEPTTRGVGDEVVQGELFALEPGPQLVLPLGGHDAQPVEKVGTSSVREKQSGTGNGNAAGGGAGVADLGRGWRRDYYSPAQRVYLDHLEQGAYNAYAGGLLFAPLLARYNLCCFGNDACPVARRQGSLAARLWQQREQHCPTPPWRSGWHRCNRPWRLGGNGGGTERLFPRTCGG